MQTLGIFLRYELLILLLVLAAIIAYKLLVRQINTDGLLLEKTNQRAFSPGRLQMLVVTVMIAIYYMFLVMDTEDTGRLPDLPNELMIALGGSHAIFLGGKLYDMLAGRFGFASPRLVNRVKRRERRKKL
jgi:hypothetical protein